MGLVGLEVSLINIYTQKSLVKGEKKKFTLQDEIT